MAHASKLVKTKLVQFRIFILTTTKVIIDYFSIAINNLYTLTFSVLTTILQQVNKGILFRRKHTHLPTWSGDLTLVGSGGVLTTGSYFSGSNLGSGVDLLPAASFTASTGSLEVSLSTASLGPSFGIISFSLSFFVSISSPVEIHCVIIML